MRLVKFGEYFFPEQTELSDNFRDLVQRTIRLPNKTGGFRVYGDQASVGEIGNIRVGFWLKPTDPGDLQDMIDAVSTLRTKGVQRLYIHLRNDEDSRRWCNAEVSNIQIAENVQNMPHMRQFVQMNFQVDDPYWYTIGKEASGGWGQGLFGAGAWGLGGVDNAISGFATTFTLTNDGNAETFPRIIIKLTGGQVVSPYIRIQRLEKGKVVDEVQFYSSLSLSDKLEINCRALSVRLNNSNAYDNNFSFLAGNFFRLKPGANSIRVLTGSSTSAATIRFYYYERFT